MRFFRPIIDNLMYFRALSIFVVNTNGTIKPKVFKCCQGLEMTKHSQIVGFM